jgi:hypothetical protein
MTPEEKQKADAWMTLQDRDAVEKRIGRVFIELLENREVGKWMLRQLIEADENSINQPLRSYFESQLQRNLRMLLADGVGNEVARLLKPMVKKEVQDYAEQVDKSLKELRRMKSKGPIHARR